MLGMHHGVIGRLMVAFRCRRTMICKGAYIRGSGYAEGLLRHPPLREIKKPK